MARQIGVLPAYNLTHLVLQHASREHVQVIVRRTLTFAATVAAMKVKMHGVLHALTKHLVALHPATAALVHKIARKNNHVPIAMEAEITRRSVNHRCATATVKAPTVRTVRAGKLLPMNACLQTALTVPMKL